jgi:hypothetical protein
MGETTDQIENYIEDKREDLSSNLQELETKVKTMTDWKHYFETSPMTMMGVAFGGGILLATMIRGKRNRNHRRLFPAEPVPSLSARLLP